MPFYECVFIMRQDISAADVAKAGDNFVSMVENLGGKLLKREYWGLRTLAYIIKKNKKAHYTMLNFEADSSAIQELERNFKINENVLKYLSIKMKKFDDQPSIILSQQEAVSQ